MDMRNTYIVICDERKKIPHSIKDIPPLRQPEQKLALLKLEEPSNTRIKKKFEVTNKEGIVNVQ